MIRLPRRLPAQWDASHLCRTRTAAAGPTTVPLALAQFQGDAHAVRGLAERDHAHIMSWNTYDRGGHYAAPQEPGLLVNDIRRFFSALTSPPG